MEVKQKRSGPERSLRFIRHVGGRTYRRQATYFWAPASAALLAKRLFVRRIGVLEASILLARGFLIAGRLGSIVVGVGLSALVDGVLRRFGRRRRRGRGLRIRARHQSAERHCAKNLGHWNLHGDSPFRC